MAKIVMKEIGLKKEFAVLKHVVELSRQTREKQKQEKK